MPTRVQRSGEYQLLETEHGNRLLVLDDDWFAWVDGQESSLLVLSDSDHETTRTLAKGDYRLIDFEGDPDFRDQPHLFLQERGGWRTLLLPNGLPTARDRQKRLVESDEKVDGRKLARYDD